MAKRTSSRRRPRRTPRPVSRRASKHRAAKRRARAAVRARQRRRGRRSRTTRRTKAIRSTKAPRKSLAPKRKPAVPRASVPAKPPASQVHDHHPATLLRERRRLPDEERVDAARIDSRLVAEARSGHDAVAASLKRYHEDGPELTAGDIDAKWDDASAIGDETPGGDNPTPDQNEVDAIGRAVRAEYEADEELMGGDEISQRDAHRWELDPLSRDDGEGGDES
jgi:hypothetical protein